MKKLLHTLFVLCLIFLCSTNLFACSNGSVSENDGRTTITKQEWNKALESGSFTMLSNFLSPINILRNGYSVSCADIIKIEGNNCSVETYDKEGHLATSYFYVLIDDSIFTIEKIDGKHVATSTESEDVRITKNLAYTLLLQFTSNWTAVYENLIYVEETKSYRAMYGTDRDNFLQVELECKNGMIEQMRLFLLGRDIDQPLPGLFTLYNFGTTKVEMPEYTIENN